MDLFRQWFAKIRNRSKVRDEKFEEETQQLLADLEAAKHDWQHAHNKLNHALDTDQIDYAIYAYQAAEKRYSMLIKKVKQLHLNEQIEKKGEQDGE